MSFKTSKEGDDADLHTMPLSRARWTVMIEIVPMIGYCSAQSMECYRDRRSKIHIVCGSIESLFSRLQAVYDRKVGIKESLHA